VFGYFLCHIIYNFKYDEANKICKINTSLPVIKNGLSR